MLVQADAPLPTLSAEVEAAVFRIASEAMSNAARHSRGSRAALRLTAEDGGLQLTVSDDGIGLPAVPREGVGLGVDGSTRAAAVGGHLRVSSPGSGGTVVTGWVSCHRTDPGDGMTVRVLEPPMTIPMFREGLRAMLAGRPNFDVVAAVGSGAEAVALTQQLRPDVAVLDLRMPDGDGIAATAQIRTAVPETRVLVLAHSRDRPRSPVHSPPERTATS